MLKEEKTDKYEEKKKYSKMGIDCSRKQNSNALPK